jgi:hypothetical protein
MKTNQKSAPWQDYVNFCDELNDGLCYDWIQVPLAYQAVEQRLLFQDGHGGGVCKVGNEEFTKQIESLGGIRIGANENQSSFRNIYSWPDAGCQYYYSYSEEEGQFHWTSNNNELSLKFKELEKLFEVKQPEGRVYVLVPCQGGLTTKSIGMGAVPLIKDNYNKEVVDGYESVVSDINSSDPLGRLSIFDGPPGTGKTYLIRALLSSLPDTKFLLLPSNMADTLTGPELLQALISESEDMVVSRPVRYRAFPRDKNPETKGFDSETVLPKKTMVLVIEDADRCLTSRGSDNISAISAILNLSDGIIGNLLDLRIVCTTNAEIDNIDAALMRSGRLSARIEVNLLDVEQAKVIYTRVGGTQEQVWDKKYYSLSDVYALAKGKVIEESPGQGNSRKQKVGFAA